MRCAPMQKRSGRVLLFLALLATLASPALASEMPEDFVYLHDVDPSIAQDMRYAGDVNFTGHAVPGYDAPECVLVRQAAEALKEVEADLKDKGLGLKAYDCYRPVRAVEAFVAWAKLPDDPEAKRTYYPNLDKNALFPDYIALQSGHSRGATLDLTLVPLLPPSTPTPDVGSPSCTAQQAGLAPDGSLAMGTSFDCFDVMANTEAQGLTEEEKKNRAMLVAAMQARGFRNYPKEWWHFTFQPEPFPTTYFDFPIEPRH
jgi:zinc D-Ala-D-Ala dipeptidase